MKETLKNLTERIAADLRSVQIGFAMLCGYLEGSEAATNERKEEKQNNTIAFKSALHFTSKELKQMPDDLQKYFIKIEIPVRQKPNGVFEARFRAHGYNIAVSSKDFELLKSKFIMALTANVRESDSTPQTAAPKFEDTAERWLELKRPTIKAVTHNYYVQLFNANILPVLGNAELANMKQSDIQALINSYIEQGKMRTATKIYQSLKAVFEFALGEELIERSPMRLLKPPKYEEKNGCALTLEEEREFLRLVNGSKLTPVCKNALLFLLYTGIRRSELASARIEGQFVSVVCAKTRKGFQEKRRLIPITPMLAGWLPNFDMKSLNAVRPDALTQAIKRLMPSHHLHELRHTFITRCQECGVPREVVSVWAGHAADNTMTSNVYTHFSKEFMTKEAAKVFYK